jgi:hypothetical protein
MSSLSLSSVRDPPCNPPPPPPPHQLYYPPLRLQRGPCIFSKTPGWRPIDFPDQASSFFIPSLALFFFPFPTVFSVQNYFSCDLYTVYCIYQLIYVSC